MISIVNYSSLQTVDQYVLLVRASDLNGAAGGNAATGTVTVKINDVNDNLPILEGPVRKYLHVLNIHKVLICCCSACNLSFFHSTQFEGSIEENTENVEVMRFKASDLDLKDTDNWASDCYIASGNEAGYFSIKMDPKTNEAILMLDKVCNVFLFLLGHYTKMSVFIAMLVKFSMPISIPYEKLICYSQIEYIQIETAICNFQAFFKSKKVTILSHYSSKQ